MGGVLDGVRVVEVSMWAMVPAAGAILAEWGADVVKVESPSGDPVRALVTAGLTPSGPKFTWEMWNRGKRDIVLDLTLVDGRDVLHEVIAGADVFLTSILPHQRAKRRQPRHNPRREPGGCIRGWHRPRGTRDNPLVNGYPTADGRWISLCMLQSDLYWAGFCHAIGRDDLVEDPRFVDSTARGENTETCVEELEKTFSSEPLAVWVERLATQEGQWDANKKVSEIPSDSQVQANRFAQAVDYGDGHELTLIASPIQCDETPPALRRAPEFAGDTDAILEVLGWDGDAILEAKAKGAVI